MSETITPAPQSPESAYRISGVPEGLQPSTLDDLVNYRVEIDKQYDAQEDTKDYRAYKAEKIDELLAENGIIDDESDEQKHEDFEFARYVYQEVINLRSDAAWMAQTEDGTSRRNDVLRAVRERYSDAHAQHDSSEKDGASTGANEPQERKAVEKEQAMEHSEALQETDARLDAITTEYANRVAERSKRMIEGAKTRKDIEASKEELSDLISAIATEYMLDIQGESNEGVEWRDMSEESRNEIIKTVDTFVAEQTDRVIAQMEERRMAEYSQARPMMKKFYDSWARWGEQGAKGKIKKGLVFAAPGAALGVALVPLAGAVGFGVIAGAAAVTGARSVARSLAGAHLDKRANSKKVAEAQSEDIRIRITDAESTAHTDILSIIDERSEAYRKRNLRRTAGGLAIALTAGLLTSKAVDLVGDNVDNWSFGKVGEWTGNLKDKIFAGDIDAPTDTETSEVRDLDGDGERNRLDLDRDGDGVDNGNDFAPNNPDVTNAPASPREQLFEGYRGSRELTAEGYKDLAELFNDYRVKPGDSVWSLSEQFLHNQGVSNPTVYEIDATKDALLAELKSSGNVDSRGWLTVGDKIRIK